jgi:RNA polymerase sigma-70 factor (ECF subfamily)
MTVMTSDTGQLWEQLHTSIRGFVSRRVRNPADVDDVVQRVFLQVHRGLPSLRDEDRVHAWVYRTAQRSTDVEASGKEPADPSACSPRRS